MNVFDRVELVKEIDAKCEGIANAVNKTTFEKVEGCSILIAYQSHFRSITFSIFSSKGTQGCDYASESEVVEGVSFLVDESLLGEEGSKDLLATRSIIQQTLDLLKEEF